MTTHGTITLLALLALGASGCEPLTDVLDREVQDEDENENADENARERSPDAGPVQDDDALWDGPGNLAPRSIALTWAGQVGRLYFWTQTVRNTGEAVVDITNIRVEGDDSVRLFSGDVLDATDDAPLSLEPGAATAFILAFEPRSLDAVRATVAIESDDPESPEWRMEVRAAGNRLADEVADHCDEAACLMHRHVSRDILTVEVGDSRMDTVYFVNRGVETLIVDRVEFDADVGFDVMWVDVMGAPVTVGPDAPLMLDPGEHANVVVRFAPQAPGRVESNLFIHSNDPVTPITRMRWGTFELRD